MDQTAWMLLAKGAWTTTWISATAIAIGVTLGLGLALLRTLRIRWLEPIMTLYVSLGRSTPLVTLVLFVFLAAPALGIDLDRNIAGVIALTLNTTAFNAEIWRSAFQSFPREQIEAAAAGGMTPFKAFYRIMLPQMTITSLPALVNEMSFLIKASPAIAIIGVVDLTRVTNRIAAVTYEPLPPILAACVIYMVLIGIMVRLQRMADQHVQRMTM